MSIHTSETGSGYVIRPIEATDWRNVRDAVLSNHDRLAVDFHLLEQSYLSVDDARARVGASAELTADPNSGYDVLVASDGGVILGVGTHQQLGRRAMWFLGLRSPRDKNGISFQYDEASLVAGWTVAHHPSDLAYKGLRTIFSLKSPKSPDKVHVHATLIRDGNVAARQVAEKAGMFQTHRSTMMPITHKRARVAGVNDGVMLSRSIWTHFRRFQ